LHETTERISLITSPRIQNYTITTYLRREIILIFVLNAEFKGRHMPVLKDLTLNLFNISFSESGRSWYYQIISLLTFKILLVT